MPITRYQALEMGIDGPAATRLFDRLDDDISTPALHLTGDGEAGAMSANLTPAMNAWLSAEVAPARLAAITAIKTAAGQIHLPGDIPGTVFEIEDDELKRHRNERRAEVYNTFHDRHGAEVEA